MRSKSCGCLIALIVSLFTLTAGHAFAQEAQQWRKVADAIPLGSKVKIQTLEGKRVSGTLMRVDDTGRGGEEEHADTGSRGHRDL